MNPLFAALFAEILDRMPREDFIAFLLESNESATVARFCELFLLRYRNTGDNHAEHGKIAA
jgi:hypothetical protein